MPGAGGGGTYVYIELIHTAVQQTLTQRCKAIILQVLKLNLIFFNLKRKKGLPAAT